MLFSSVRPKSDTIESSQLEVLSPIFSILLVPGSGPYVISARPMAISGLNVWTYLIYDLFVRGWNPTDVKSQILWSVFPVGADTAGVRRGARSAMRADGRAVKVCNGVLSPEGQFKIGGVSLGDFSVTYECIR